MRATPGPALRDNAFTLHKTETPDMTVITNVEDLRVLAQKRVPRMFYDYADSGSWTEGTYRANNEDFQKIKLRQRVAVNMENRSTRSTMIGQPVAMPVAIAPTGLTGMQHADGEILAARAAAYSVSFNRRERETARGDIASPATPSGQEAKR